MSMPLAKKRAMLDYVINEMKKHYRLVSVAEHAESVRGIPVRERGIDVLSRGREA